MPKLIASVLIAWLVMFSMGCLSPPEETSDKITNLRIGYQPTTHHVAEMVAAEKGWWLEDLKPFEITEIKEFGYPSGIPQMKAMEDGDLDITYLCTSPFISPISRGLDAKIVAAVNINGSNLVLRPGINYNGPQSLRGLSIGTFPAGTAQDTLLKIWLSENDVDISEIDIKTMGPGDAVTAMLSGKVDGVFLPQPAPAIIEIEGGGKSVLTSGDIWPNHACCGIAVSGKLIREHPDLVEQVIKTHINATNYANTHPEEAARIYCNYTGQDLKAIEHSIRTWDGRWVNDPHLLINDTVKFAEFQYDTKYIQKKLTDDDLFDTSFYDKEGVGR